VGGGPDALSKAITRQAEERHQALQDRVLAALTDHEDWEHGKAESALLPGR
jgi:hypothetical protein